jgi:hypothetical protein
VTFYQFIALNYETKAKQVLNEVFLGDRKVKDNYISLFALDGFYVEVYYSLTIHTIVKMRVFNDISLLEPYLDQINFEELGELL